MGVLEPFNAAQAAASIVAMAEKGYLAEPLASAILDVPLPQANMRYDEGKTLELKRLSRFELTCDMLLQNHNVMALNEKGAIRLIDPAEQVNTSRHRAVKRLDSVLRGAMQEANYLDTRRLNAVQVADQNDYAGWLGQLRLQIVPNGRRLKHAMRVDVHYAKPTPRVRLVHPAPAEASSTTTPSNA